MRQCVNEEILNFFRYFDFNQTSLTVMQNFIKFFKKRQKGLQGTEYNREFCNQMGEKNDEPDRDFNPSPVNL